MKGLVREAGCRATGRRSGEWHRWGRGKDTEEQTATTSLLTRICSANDWTHLRKSTKAAGLDDEKNEKTNKQIRNESRSKRAISNMCSSTI